MDHNPIVRLDSDLLAAALHEALPEPLRPSSRDLAEAVIAHLTGHQSIAPGAAMQLRSALEALAGYEVPSGGALIQFPSSAQLGDVRIGDVAGHDINKNR